MFSSNQKHQQTGKDTQKFICTDCGKSYPLQSTMFNHIRMKHNNDKSLIFCENPIPIGRPKAQKKTESNLLNIESIPTENIHFLPASLEEFVKSSLYRNIFLSIGAMIKKDASAINQQEQESFAKSYKKLIKPIKKDKKDLFKMMFSCIQISILPHIDDEYRYSFCNDLLRTILSFGIEKEHAPNRLLENVDKVRYEEFTKYLIEYKLEQLQFQNPLLDGEDSQLIMSKQNQISSEEEQSVSNTSEQYPLVSDFNNLNQSNCKANNDSFSEENIQEGEQFSNMNNNSSSVHQQYSNQNINFASLSEQYSVSNINFPSIRQQQQSTFNQNNQFESSTYQQLITNQSIHLPSYQSQMQQQQPIGSENTQLLFNQDDNPQNQNQFNFPIQNPQQRNSNYFNEIMDEQSQSEMQFSNEFSQNSQNNFQNQEFNEDSQEFFRWLTNDQNYENNFRNMTNHKNVANNTINQQLPLITNNQSATNTQDTQTFQSNQNYREEELSQTYQSSSTQQNDQCQLSFLTSRQQDLPPQISHDFNNKQSYNAQNYNLQVFSLTLEHSSPEIVQLNNGQLYQQQNFEYDFFDNQSDDYQRNPSIPKFNNNF